MYEFTLICVQLIKRQKEIKKIVRNYEKHKRSILESIPYPRFPFYLRGFVPVWKYDIRYQIFLIELVENVTNFSPLVFFLIDCSVNGSVRFSIVVTLC